MNKSETTTNDLLKLAKKMNLTINDVLFKNQLKLIKIKPGGYIINMANDNDGTNGTHWVGLWLDKKTKMSFYFDSLGFPPPLEVIDFMKKFNNKEYIYNSIEYQNANYGHCGQYVLLFLAAMKFGSEKDLENRLIKYFDKYNVNGR